MQIDVRDVGSISELRDLLEEGIAAHSNILAWRIPWTEESGRLQPMGSRRVRHDLAVKQLVPESSHSIRRKDWKPVSGTYPH